jgi:hypothetical protein
LRDLGVYEWIILKWMLKKQDVKVRLNSSGSGLEPAAGFCENGNELSGSIKGGEFHAEFFLVYQKVVIFSVELVKSCPSSWSFPVFLVYNGRRASSCER